MENLEKIAEELVSLNVKQVTELLAILKEKYGIEPAVISQVGPGAVDSKSQVQEEEKTSFDVVLKSAGSSKLQVIKKVRELLGIGLKEAKDLVDGAPKVLKEKISKDESSSIKLSLEEVGAEVEVQ